MLIARGARGWSGALFCLCHCILSGCWINRAFLYFFLSLLHLLTLSTLLLLFCVVSPLTLSLSPSLSLTLSALLCLWSSHADCIIGPKKRYSLSDEAGDDYSCTPSMLSSWHLIAALAIAALNPSGKCSNSICSCHTAKASAIPIRVAAGTRQSAQL